jgi:hypothetical protein
VADQLGAALAERSGLDDRRELVTHMSDDGLIYKTREQPQQPRQAGQVGEDWNVWVKRHIQHALDAHDDAIGQVIAEERERARRECERTIEPLKQEIAELRGEVRALLAIMSAKGDVVSLSGRKPHIG